MLPSATAAPFSAEASWLLAPFPSCDNTSPAGWEIPGQLGEMEQVLRRKEE